MPSYRHSLGAAAVSAVLFSSVVQVNHGFVPSGVHISSISSPHHSRHRNQHSDSTPRPPHRHSISINHNTHRAPCHHRCPSRRRCGATTGNSATRLQVSMHDNHNQQQHPRNRHRNNNGSQHSPPSQPQQQTINFYEILGVSPHSSSDEIKRAYRKMAKKYHPDSNKEDLDATDKFQQVNRAYEVLRNPVLKGKFDMFGADGIGTSAASDEVKTNRVYTSGASTGSTRRRSGGMGGGVGISPDGFSSYSYGGPQQGQSSPHYSNPYSPADFPFGSSYGGSFGMGGGRHSSPQHPADIFDRTGRGTRGHGMVGDDLQLDMNIDFETAILGGRESIWVDHLESCEYCSGTGDKAAGMSGESNNQNNYCCQTCGGAGFIVDLTSPSFGSLQTQRSCRSCRGSGKVLGMEQEDCDHCHGRGMVERSRQVDVTIPAGVEGYTRLRIRGEGNAGPRGGPPGDLFIFLHVSPHPTLVRAGSDIHANHTVNYIDAILGNLEMETPVVGGKHVKIKVPKGTQQDDQICVHGLGARRLVGEPGSRGDHYVHVKLGIPQDIDMEEEEILERLRELHNQREAVASSKQRQYILETQDDDQGNVMMDESNLEAMGGGDSDLKEIASSFSAHFSTIDIAAPVKKQRPHSPAKPKFNVVDTDTIRIDAFEKKYVTEDSITAKTKTTKAPQKLETEDFATDPLPQSSIDSTSNTIVDPETDTPFFAAELSSEPETPFFARADVNPVNELDKPREWIKTPVKSTKKTPEAKRKAREFEDMTKNELDKLRELLYAPVEATKKTTDAKQKAREVEMMTNNELDKLRELLYAPVESTKKTTDAKQKAREVELMTNNELDKLRELLYAPVESTKKSAEATRKARETEEMTMKELELLRQLLYEPLSAAETPKKKVVDTRVSSEKTRRLNERQKLAELLVKSRVEQPVDKESKSKSKANVPAGKTAMKGIKDSDDKAKAKGVVQGVSSDMNEEIVIPTVISQRPKRTRKANPWVFETKKGSANAKDSIEDDSGPIIERSEMESKSENTSANTKSETSVHSLEKVETPINHKVKNEEIVSEPISAPEAALLANILDDVVDVMLHESQHAMGDDSDEKSDPVQSGVLGTGASADEPESSKEDDDERSFAWDEITADSWRRKDPSDPPAKGDGRKFEETLFSIFKL